MAIRFDAIADNYFRSTSPTFPNTIMFWVKIVVDLNNFCVMIAWDGANDFYLGTGGNGTILEFYPGPGAAGIDGTDLIVGQWYHVAIVSGAGTGASRNIYLNGALDISTTSDEPPSGLLYIANDANDEWINASMAALKIYNAVLTQREIQQEMRQYKPVRKSDIHLFCPMLDVGTGGNDFSGNGRNLTAGGTLTTEDGPPIPWELGAPGRFLQELRQ
ncbi:MAG TPA: LamG domain-containing protein [Blastocatellia bacterium]|nr:LamG domain-containing protein [Blastocatellia bacterium]